jgi:hypothetical protein
MFSNSVKGRVQRRLYCTKLLKEGIVLDSDDCRYMRVHTMIRIAIRVAIPMTSGWRTVADIEIEMPDRLLS